VARRPIRRRGVGSPDAVRRVRVTAPEGTAAEVSAAGAPAVGIAVSLFVDVGRWSTIRAHGAGATASRAARTARLFAVVAGGARQVVTGSLAAGALIAAGWLLAVLFGLLGASPAAAQSTAADSTAAKSTAVDTAAEDMAAADTAAEPVRTGGFPGPRGRMPVHAEASVNAEAMAGRGVDGLTSQSGPALPSPTTIDHTSGADGFVPQSGGGSGQFGPGMGDLARSSFDPRLIVLRAPVAPVLPPVVRTAADEPSFSPD
jgi:hypothetical protein